MKTFCNVSRYFLHANPAALFDLTKKKFEMRISKQKKVNETMKYININ